MLAEKKVSCLVSLYYSMQIWIVCKKSVFCLTHSTSCIVQRLANKQELLTFNCFAVLCPGLKRFHSYLVSLSFRPDHLEKSLKHTTHIVLLILHKYFQNKN